MFNGLANVLRDKSFVSRSLNVLRGIAIVLVVVVHTRNFAYYTGMYEYARFMDPVYYYFVEIDWLAVGVAGVALFFFLSGYLLDMIYRDMEDLKTYFVRRFFRIFPLWFLWTLVAVVVAGLGLQYGFENADAIMKYVYGSAPNVFADPRNWLIVLFSVLFLGFLIPRFWNNIVMGGWSIQLEVFNYVLFPFINRVSLTVVLGVLGIVQGLTVIFQNVIVNPVTIAFITSPYWFILGVFVSRVMRKYVYGGDERIERIDFLLMGVASLLTALLPFVTNMQYVNFIVLFGSLLFIFVFRRFNRLNSLFVSFGKYSYGMFFNHWVFALPLSFVAGWFVSLAPLSFRGFAAVSATVVLVVFVLFLSWFFSKVLYRFVEDPFIRIGQKF